VELLDRRQHRLPFRDGLPGQVTVHGGDQRGRILAGGHAGPHLARDPAEVLGLRPLAVVGHVDCSDRETALGDEAARAGQDAGGLLVLPAAVSHQDQGASPGGAFRRPQHTGYLAEGKQLFNDAIG